MVDMNFNRVIERLAFGRSTRQQTPVRCWEMYI